MRHLRFSQTRRLRRSAKGQAMIEIIGSLLMFVIMICLMVTVSLYLYVQHAAVSVAREGARFASLNPDIGSQVEQDQGIDDTRDYVINSARQLAGMRLEDGNILITPPDPGSPQGQRTVRVDLQFNMNNPIPIGGFLDKFNTDGAAFKNIPINATATMRYEE